MARLLLFILLAAVVYLWIRGKLSRPRAPKAANPSSRERLVQCSRCGVWIPEHLSRSSPSAKPVCDHCRNQR